MSVVGSQTLTDPASSPHVSPLTRTACRRVRVMMEVLRGIRQIKCCAMEALFTHRVGCSRAKQ